MTGKLTEGWQKPTNSRKFHYYDAEGRSLCGKWFTFALDFQSDTGPSPDDCAGCRRKLDKG